MIRHKIRSKQRFNRYKPGKLIVGPEHIDYIFHIIEFEDLERLIYRTQKGQITFLHCFRGFDGIRNSVFFFRTGTNLGIFLQQIYLNDGKYILTSSQEFMYKSS